MEGHSHFSSIPGHFLKDRAVFLGPQASIFSWLRNGSTWAAALDQGRKPMLRTAGQTQRPGSLGTKGIRAAPTLPPETLGLSPRITQVREEQTVILLPLLHFGGFL